MTNARFSTVNFPTTQFWRARKFCFPIATENVCAPANFLIYLVNLDSVKRKCFDKINNNRDIA